MNVSSPLSDYLPLIKAKFPQLSDSLLLDQMMSDSKVMSFRPGETIMDYGSYVRMVPLLLEGSIKVMREGEDGEELLLYYLNEGETCSMSFTCCMMDKQSAIRTVAEDDTTLISIPLEQVNRWMNEFPAWRNFVMLSYDQRILELVKTIDGIAFKKMDQRLLEYLIKKSQAIQSTSISTTHQEIAYDLNASREAVSRLLKQLEKTGKVRLGRNKIELLN